MWDRILFVQISLLLPANGYFELISMFYVLFLIFQIDPKVAFPRKPNVTPQPKVSVSIPYTIVLNAQY